MLIARFRHGKKIGVWSTRVSGYEGIVSGAPEGRWWMVTGVMNRRRCCGWPGSTLHGKTVVDSSRGGQLSCCDRDITGLRHLLFFSRTGFVDADPATGKCDTSFSVGCRIRAS